MSFAKSTIVKRIRKRLDDEPFEDSLAVSINASALTFNVGQPTQWAEGDRMEFDDDTGEIARLSATPSANPVAVKRAHNGTTAAAHDGTVTPVPLLKNPTFEYDEILESVNRTIDDLWPHVYFVDTTTLTAVQSKRYYDLPATFKELISAVQDITTTAGQYQILEYGKRGTGYAIGVRRGVPSTVAATAGLALYIPQVRTSPTTDILVKFGRVVATTLSSGNYTDLSDGIEVDTVVHLAVAKLMEDRDTQRNRDDVQQGDIGVPPGSFVKDAAWYQNKGEQLREAWRLRLDREYPLTSPWEK